MSLSEVMVSALLLALAGAHALGGWAGALAWSHGQRQRADLLVQLDRELQVLQARWRVAGVSEPPSSDCAAALQRMEQRLVPLDPRLLALAPDLERLLQHDADGLRLTFRSAALGLERQRWWSPQVFGFCTPDDAAAGAGVQP